jgi:membrane protein YdbS with pleckstrin-like domain
MKKEEMEKLHPGAKWIFRLRTYWGLIILLIVLVPMGIGLLLESAIAGGASKWAFNALLPFMLIIFFLTIISAEIYARLAYKFWKYKFTQRELKIEKGIIFKTYKSIPYERVQNVDIHRGILARMLGFSSVSIQTAGYSGGYHRGHGRSMSEGHIPAVSAEHAEEIRDWIMKKIVGKNSGI